MKSYYLSCIVCLYFCYLQDPCLGLRYFSIVKQNSLDLTRSRSKFTLNYNANVLGSDQLQRPEDEDSPEFKEYLRALLQMQASRAKSGFAAPSSGSADAYIAKLTRMKIERNARIRAGLPDTYSESGYVPEDYKAAL